MKKNRNKRMVGEKQIWKKKERKEQDKERQEERKMEA